MTRWFKKIGLVLLAGVLLSGCANQMGLSEENYLTPRQVNANASKLDGKEIFVRGYVLLGTNARGIFQSEERHKEFQKDWEEDRPEEEMEKYDNDCLTLLHANLLFKNRPLFDLKTITFKGVVKANHLDGNMVDLQACLTPPGLILDPEYLNSLLLSLQAEE